MTQAGHPVSHATIERLLKARHYLGKANEKRLTRPAHPERKQQFEEKGIQVAEEVLRSYSFTSSKEALKQTRVPISLFNRENVTKL